MTAEVVGDVEGTLTADLIARGVTPIAAQRAAVEHPAARIRKQMEIFDWLMQRKDARVSRNPAGFLMSSIAHEYAPPKEFERQASEQRKFTRRRANATQRAVTIAEDHREKHQRSIVDAFWAALPESERQEAEQEALDGAGKLEFELITRGGPLAEAARRRILDSYAVKLMK
jgi:hypothetical protein